MPAVRSPPPKRTPSTSKLPSVNETPIRNPSSSPSSSSSDHPDEDFDNRVLEAIKGPSYMVTFYSPSDTTNPQNLPPWRKWCITMSIALYVLTTTFSSSSFSAVAAAVAGDLGVAMPHVVLAGTSMFMLGFALGSVIFGPLSEHFGRKVPLVVGYVCFAVMQAPVGRAESLGTIGGARFLQGVFGSAPSAVLSGVLADMWTPQERGFAMPAVGSFLMIGPILGPIVGSVVGNGSLGWRWISYLTAIVSLSVAVLTFPFLRETYSPVLLAQRAARMRHMTQNWAYRAKSEEEALTTRGLLNKTLAKPARMLFLEPILLLMSIYIAVVFGLMYVFFMAYPMSFVKDRHWPQTKAGLPLLAILTGCILASVLISCTTRTRFAPDPIKGRPCETRMLFMTLGGICLPLGIIWFALASSPSSPAIPQILAGIPIGVGIILVNMQGMNYIIDCYLIHANSAIAANTFLRSIFAAVFPVFATKMYGSLGVERATLILGGLGCLLVPIPVLFFRFGEKIRRRSRWVPQ